MDVNSFAVTCVFVGFIIGTLPDLWKDAGARERNSLSYISMIIGFVALCALLLFFKNGNGVNLKPDFIGFFLCGIMWGLSFIVPGLSSSTLIIFFGLYQDMLEGISKISFSVVIPLGIGMLLCVLTLSRVVNNFLKHHHSVAMHAIIGIVASSMTMVIPPEVFSLSMNLLMGLLYICLGGLTSYFAGKICNNLVK